MSTHSNEQGFTLIEMLMVIMLIAILAIIFLVTFRSSLISYLNLQQDSMSMTQLSSQEMRVATVLRGLTDITSADANDLQIYTYFYPSDTYVSQVHYYVSTVSGVSKLLADVTPMSANPPQGTPLTSQKQTYTVIDNLYQPSGSSVFTYLDANGSALSLPITDLQSVKGIQVTLASSLTQGKTQSVNVQVSLRNRKSNL